MWENAIGQGAGGPSDLGVFCYVPLSKNGSCSWLIPRVSPVSTVLKYEISMTPQSIICWFGTSEIVKFRFSVQVKQAAFKSYPHHLKPV